MSQGDGNGGNGNGGNVEATLQQIVQQLARMEMRLGQNETGIANMQRQMNTQVQPMQPPQDRRMVRQPHRRQEEVLDEFEDEEGQGRRGRDALDRNLGGIKVAIPPFYGRSDPEEYLEWEKKVERVFDLHNYSEEKKVKLAVVEFADYASSWWDQVVSNRRYYEERQVDTWRDLKGLMRKRFVPYYHHREVLQRLQGLKQGSKSVEDYHKEMERLLIRANIVEDREATIVRFISGLNRDIRHLIEFQQFVTLEDAVHAAIRAEKQLQERKVGKFNSQGSGSTDWKTNWSKKDEKSATRSTESKDRPYERGSSSKGKEVSTSPAQKHSKIQCFRCLGHGHIASQCPNKRVMFARGDGTIDSQGESGDEFELPLDEDHEIEYPMSGDVLVVRRALNAQAKDEGEEQRENIFHTRCEINGKIYSMIIDGGSCTNVASTTLVDKLGLQSVNHPRPYKLQWLNECGEVRVNKQVLVAFSIGKYVDEVLCDVVPMHAGHILLGRPWQYDKRATHDGFTNRYSFVMGKKTIILAPLTPSQVYEDQVRLKKSLDEEKKREPEKKKLERKEAEKKNDNGPNEGRNESEQKGGKHVSFYAKIKECRSAFVAKRALIVLRYKESLLSDSDINLNLPSTVVSLLQEYKDVFPDEIPKELPPVRGIEHQIDFVPGSTILNRPPYRNNPEETKELQRQV